MDGRSNQNRISLKALLEQLKQKVGENHSYLLRKEKFWREL